MTQCTVCTHRDRFAIDRDLIAGKTVRTIAQRYKVSRDALGRHKRTHLTAAGAVVDQLAGTATAPNDAVTAYGRTMLADLGATFNDVRKLLDACKDWLTDPDNPERFDLCPRAEEIDVVYTAVNGAGRRVRYKENLAQMLAVALDARNDAEPNVVRLIGKQTDTRELFLKAVKLLEAQSQTLARILAQLDAAAAEPESNRLATWEEWCQLRTLILNVITPCERCTTALDEALTHAHYA